MKKYFLLFSYFFISFFTIAQSLDDIDFGTDTTFEIVTWNIENFPKNGEVTMAYVADIVEALDADIIAVQEINDIEAFHNMVSDMPSYSSYYTQHDYLNLGYIFKENVIQINAIYEIYVGNYNPFPRPPFVFELTFMNENYIIINNHFKCCGDGILDVDNSNDQETRRFLASNLIKDYIDTNFPSDTVIVLGDLNDVLTDSPENNVFQAFLDDPENYLFADMEIALGGSTEWSFPTWPSHIDHILITNQLFDEFEDTTALIQTLKIEEYLTGGWNEYDTNISDHLPVALKIVTNTIGINDFDQVDHNFRNYPNPASNQTTFYFDTDSSITNITLYTITGQSLEILPILNAQDNVIWNTIDIPSGLYFARLQNSNETISSIKVLVKP